MLQNFMHLLYYVHCLPVEGRRPRRKTQSDHYLELIAMIATAIGRLKPYVQMR